MLIVINKNTQQAEIDVMINDLKQYDVSISQINHGESKVICLSGNIFPIDERKIYAYRFVEKVTKISEKYKLASREFKKENTIIEIGDIKIGEGNFSVIAGPCSVESEEKTLEIAKSVASLGVKLFRGGAYKPRTSPYAFQGLKEKGLEILNNVKKETGMFTVSEIMSEQDIEKFIDKVDILQVGARNMQNYELLKALGNIKKPILLKRGPSSTVEEWLLAAEYILAGGNQNVILCERGIKTFETATRNTLDLSVIPLVKKLSHLPVFVDPSHGTGKWDLVEPMSLAALACGADGIMVEVHSDPTNALSDGAQSLTIKNFEELMKKITKISSCIGKKL